MLWSCVPFWTSVHFCWDAGWFGTIGTPQLQHSAVAAPAVDCKEMKRQEGTSKGCSFWRTLSPTRQVSDDGSFSRMQTLLNVLYASMLRMLVCIYVWTIPFTSLHRDIMASLHAHWFSVAKSSGLLGFALWKKNQGQYQIWDSSWHWRVDPPKWSKKWFLGLVPKRMRMGFSSTCSPWAWNNLSLNGMSELVKSLKLDKRSFAT